MGNLLKIFGVVIVLFATYGCGSDNSTTTAKRSVIVVGAGISGLRAANKLTDAGMDVVVLEARNRVGGRLWSDRSIEGVTLDLGASWIHGINDSLLYDYAKGLDVPMAEFDYGKVSIYGHLGGDSGLKPEDGAAISEIIEEYALPAYLENPIATVQDAVDMAKASGDLAAYTDEQVNSFVTRDIELGMAMDADKLPVIALMGSDESEEEENPEVVFPNGYDQLTTALAKGLDVRLNTKVTKVDYTQEKVSVVSDNGIFEADYVLVTVPLGVLKKKIIEFNPELPTKKMEAIKALDMGVLAKVFLRFPEVFWTVDKDQYALGYTNKEKGQFTAWINFAPIVDQPVLMGFNAGSYAYEIEGLTTEEVTTRAMKVLRTMYGDSIPEPTDVRVSRWSRDPYSYGSYSAPTIDSTDESIGDLAESVSDKVFFSGEATSLEQSSTVDGAFLSGEREAAKIIALQ